MSDISHKSDTDAGILDKSSSCHDEKCDEPVETDDPLHPDEDDDEEQKCLQLEFISFIQQMYPPHEMQQDSEDTYKQKMEDLYQQFQDIKIRQAEEMEILGREIERAQSILREKCEDKYKVFFKASYWIDSIRPEAKASLEQLRAYPPQSTECENDIDTNTNNNGIEHIAQHVYRFQIYDTEFLDHLSSFLSYCKSLLLSHHITLSPPNTMNRYGLTLEYIGLGPCIHQLSEYILRPIITAYYPELLMKLDPTGCIASELQSLTTQPSSSSSSLPSTQADAKFTSNQSQLFTSVHAFTVEYKPKEDTIVHTDQPSPSTNTLQIDQLNTDCDINPPPTPLLSPHNNTQHNTNKHDDDDESNTIGITPLNKFNTSGLNMHVDASQMTLNICLDNTFTGGNLILSGHRCGAHQHQHLEIEKSDDGHETLFQRAECGSIKQKPGSVLIHSGTLRHGAEPILSGYRQNLIIWAQAPHLGPNATIPCAICDILDSHHDDDEHHCCDHEHGREHEHDSCDHDDDHGSDVHDHHEQKINCNCDNADNQHNRSCPSHEQ